MATFGAQLSPPEKLPRVRRDQNKRLEESFSQSRNPTEFELVLLAAEVGLNEEEVVTWFKHRLALWRKQQGLPANEGSIYD